MPLKFFTMEVMSESSLSVSEVIVLVMVCKCNYCLEFQKFESALLKFGHEHSLS